MIRRAKMLIHWSLPLLIIGTLARHDEPAWPWILALTVLIWIVISVVVGLYRPGPALTGWLRPLHRHSHIALLAFAAVACIVTLFGDVQLGRRMLFILLGFGALHGIFNLWRHTVLGDGALRTMLPKAILGE